MVSDLYFYCTKTIQIQISISVKQRWAVLVRDRHFNFKCYFEFLVRISHDLCPRWPKLASLLKINHIYCLTKALQREKKPYPPLFMCEMLHKHDTETFDLFYLQRISLQHPLCFVQFFFSVRRFVQLKHLLVRCTLNQIHTFLHIFRRNCHAKCNHVMNCYPAKTSAHVKIQKSTKHKLQLCHSITN